MAKRHHPAGGLAARRVEPRHKTRRCVNRPQAARLELHLTCRRAKADAGQGVDDDAQARETAERIVPRAWLVAIHVLEKAGPIRAAQDVFHLTGQCQGLWCAPLRQHPRVHHQQRARVGVFNQRQVLLAQPVQQGLAVRRGQHVGNGVAAMRLAHAVGAGEQVQVVVAQQTAGRVAKTHQAAQHAG